VATSQNVLSRDLQLTDLDQRHWTNWWHLLVPPRVLDRPRWALVVTDGPVVLKVIAAGHGARGSLPPPAKLPPLGNAWARELGVDAIVVIERAVIAQLSAQIERQLSIDQDIVEQGLVALRALKRHAGKGVRTYPALLDLLPAPAYDPIQRTFDLLVPDKSALAAYVIDDDRRSIHASIIAVKRGGDIVHAATHRAIADVVPERGFAREWEKRTDEVAHAIERKLAAKPAIAVFLERATWQRIVTGPGDQLGREINAKRVVVDPAPAWLLGLLGGATALAVASRGARAVAGMLPAGARERASELAARAGQAIKDSGAHPFAMLGFDPIELWTRLKHFYRS
jgi:hypothetical protein